jgi:phage/plasmid-like protein (TIGR03299 family)
MSHQIANQANGQAAAVFSALEGAGWTGLGQEIPADMANDPRAIAKLCGANFTVEKRECYFKSAEGTYKAARGKDVLVRTDTDRMLSVVSDNRYHVTNRQPVDIFEAFRDELAQNNLTISHGAVLRGGADIVVCALLPSEFDIVVGNGDRIKQYVTASTGYNGHGTRVTKSGYRVVCANTHAANIADAEAKDKIRTIRASTQLERDSIANLIVDVKKLVDAERATFDAMANTRMSNEDVARYFADVLEFNIADLNRTNANGKKLVSTKTQNIVNQLLASYANAPGADMAMGTAWGAFNAVTYYATHLKTVRDTSGSGESAARVASNLNGDAAQMKLRALQLAASYSDIAVAA